MKCIRCGKKVKALGSGYIKIYDKHGKRVKGACICEGCLMTEKIVRDIDETVEKMDTREDVPEDVPRENCSFCGKKLPVTALITFGSSEEEETHYCKECFKKERDSFAF